MSDARPRFAPNAQRPTLNALVECAIPRVASDAIDYDMIRSRARRAGIERPSIKLSTYITPSCLVRIRIATDLCVAPFIVDRLYEVAALQRHSRTAAAGNRAIAFADAVDALLAAIDNGLGANLALTVGWLPPSTTT